MTEAEALAIIGTYRWISITPKSCKVTSYTPVGILGASVRRRKNETFGMMLIRCAQKAAFPKVETRRDKDAAIAASLGIEW